MKPENFISTVCHMVAVTSVGPSALRGQGKGVLKVSQGFLASLSLECIPSSCEGEFRSWLDRQTKILLDKLPITGRPWGAARKALNLFLRDILYNKYLSSEFEIEMIEPWLEVPLDSAVARGLKSEAGRGRLPQWPGLKNLNSDASYTYQNFAATYANSLDVERVHLDMYLWLENR